MDGRGRVVPVDAAEAVVHELACQAAGSCRGTMRPNRRPAPLSRSLRLRPTGHVPGQAGRLGRETASASGPASRAYRTGTERPGTRRGATHAFMRLDARDACSHADLRRLPSFRVVYRGSAGTACHAGGRGGESRRSRALARPEALGPGPAPASADVLGRSLQHPLALLEHEAETRHRDLVPREHLP